MPVDIFKSIKFSVFSLLKQVQFLFTVYRYMTVYFTCLRNYQNKSILEGSEVQTSISDDFLTRATKIRVLVRITYFCLCFNFLNCKLG